MFAAHPSHDPGISSLRIDIVDAATRELRLEWRIDSECFASGEVMDPSAMHARWSQFLAMHGAACETTTVRALDTHSHESPVLLFTCALHLPSEPGSTGTQVEIIALPRLARGHRVHAALHDAGGRVFSEALLDAKEPCFALPCVHIAGSGPPSFPSLPHDSAWPFASLTAVMVVAVALASFAIHHFHFRKT